MRERGATRLESLAKREAEFIEPMDCAPVTKLSDGPRWLFEIKLDGYRAIAVKADGRVNLFSRRRKSFDHHYPLIVEALAELPEATVVDGEIVALDDIFCCNAWQFFGRMTPELTWRLGPAQNQCLARQFVGWSGADLGTTVDVVARPAGLALG